MVFVPLPWEEGFFSSFSLAAMDLYLCPGDDRVYSLFLWLTALAFLGEIVWENVPVS